MLYYNPEQYSRLEFCSLETMLTSYLNTVNQRIVHYTGSTVQKAIKGIIHNILLRWVHSTRFNNGYRWYPMKATYFIISKCMKHIVSVDLGKAASYMPFSSGYLGNSVPLDVHDR